jgi:parallel beta-helix repeat protein
VWCLRKDLSTNITSGNAITIAANNVTIDCNDFKLGGLAGGDGSLSVGIRASARQNATVRHCGIRGFYYGVYLDGGGHVVEDNRLDSNLLISILVQGDNNTVQRNRVYDTGGALGQNTATGISAYAHILDNTVSGVFAVATDTTLFGIRIYGVGNEARDNRVSGLEAKGNGLPYGIDVHSSGIVDGNRIIATTATFGSGYGIYSGGGSIFVCKDNVANGFQAGVGISGCTTSSGDVAIP